MGLFDHFPYTNVHELNLDWVLSMMKALEAEWEHFTAGNSLTFADPMIHDITKTYAKNTIVLDGNGNAYVSLQAVPVGVGLQNTDYWLMVFDYEAFIEKVNKNFTANYYRGSYRATSALSTGDWLTVDDVLYKATTAIAVDDTLEDGVNITHFTLEDFIKAFIQSATQMINQYKYDIDASELEFKNTLQALVDGYYNDTQAQITQILNGATVDSEVINARVAYYNKQYSTLKERLDAEVAALQAHDNLKTFVIGGIANDGHFIQVTTNRVLTPLMTKVNKNAHFKIDSGYKVKLIYYSEPIISAANYLHAQASWVTDSDGWYYINDSYVNNYFIVLIGKSDDTDFSSADLLTIGEVFHFMPIDFELHGDYIADGSTIDLNSDQFLTKALYVGQSTNYCTLVNQPPDYTGTPTAFNIITFPNSFRQTQTEFCTQIFFTPTAAWYRIVTLNRGSDTVQIFKNWTVLFGTPYTSKLYGKNVAILGDSISTNSNPSYPANVPEIEITADDVGQTLSAYVTYYDVSAGLEIDGYTYVTSDIGTEVTFTPTAGDVGKVIGRSQNYNPTSIKPWWAIAADELGFNPIPNCWSGASYSSHEKTASKYKASYAWHDAIIRKCGIRTAGTMTRTAPDLIIVVRGVNDMTHTPYTVLTDNYFDNYDWNYPNDDELISGDFSFYDAVALTIKKLRAAYPDTPIILATFTAFKRVNYSKFPVNNGINSAPQYNDAMRKIADFFGCHLIEFDKDGITFENVADYSRSSDGATPTHPTNDGHKILAQQAITDIIAGYNVM